MTAAGKERNNRSFRIQVVQTAKLCSIKTSMDFAGQWMSDILDAIHASLCKPLNFKRKNRQHEIDVASYLIYTIRAPRPKLWTDVVDHLEATRMQRLRQTQVEFRPIDHDHGVGFLLQRRLV